MRGRTVEVTCKCGTKFQARVADRARGWGKYCSKSCKAKVQEKRTGQYSHFLQGKHSEQGSNRWKDDEGNQFARRWGPNGRSHVSKTDHMTGDVEIEQFDRHGMSEGFFVSGGEDDF